MRFAGNTIARTFIARFPTGARIRSGVGLLVGLAVVFLSGHELLAAPGDLLFKLTSPDPQPGAAFGRTLAVVDGDIVIAEPKRIVDNTAFVGQAYLFDSQTGELKLTIENPEPARGDGFADSVAGGDGLLFFSARGVDERVYVFDQQSGEMLRRIDDPNAPPHPFGGKTGFGASLSYGGGILAITAPSFNVGGFDNAGQVHLYSPLVDGPQLTIPHPEPATNDALGAGSNSAAVFGDYVAAGSILADSGIIDLPEGEDAGRVWVFDRHTGEVAFTLENPDPKSVFFDWFGSAIASNQERIVVGAQEDTIAGLRGAGGVFVYDGLTGDLEHSLFSPQIEANGEFGHSVALTPSGDVVVGAWGTSADDIEGAGHVYLFDGDTGDLLLDIPNPEPNTFAAFGWSVTALDDRIIVEGLQAGTGDLPATGAVYVFSTVPEPSSILLALAAAMMLSMLRVRRKCPS